MKTREIENLKHRREKLEFDHENGISLFDQVKIRIAKNKELKIISSRQIARLLHKSHSHILKECIEYNEEYKKLNLPLMEKNLYHNSRNKECCEYVLSKAQGLDVASKYGFDMNRLIYRSCDLLEKEMYDEQLYVTNSEMILIQYELLLIYKGETDALEKRIAHLEARLQCNMSNEEKIGT